MANYISGNLGDGVRALSGTTGNSILGNAIAANGEQGIDLNHDGVTPNDVGDPDTGANDLQNYPVLTSVTGDHINTTILGSLNSTPNTTFLLEFFTSDVCDGGRFLESATVTTAGTGNANFRIETGPALVFIAATATNLNTMNTSEFSRCKPVINTPEGESVTVLPIASSTQATPVVVTFNIVDEPGTTFLQIHGSGPSDPFGFQAGAPQTYYDISSTAVFSGTVSVTIAYAGQTFEDESRLRMLHFEEGDGTWADITAAVDTETKTITGTTTTLSPFAVFESLNQPPDCSEAKPSIAEIWPPNHKMVDIEILGVTDPDDDPVTVTITGITQDEPVEAQEKGDLDPHGAGVNIATAQVRAERLGSGNGRVYEISFTASDGRGGESEGSVTVCVPHDRRKKGTPCVDDGRLYNSVTGAPIVFATKPVMAEQDLAFGVGNYPNPFNPSTTIHFTLPEPSSVRLTIYNALGQEVRTLLNTAQEAGEYTVQWDGRDARGQVVSTGVYLYRLQAGLNVAIRKMVLAK